MSDRTERRNKRVALKEGNADSSEERQKSIAENSDSIDQLSPKKAKLIGDETEGREIQGSTTEGKLDMKYNGGKIICITSRLLYKSEFLANFFLLQKMREAIQQNMRWAK